MNSIKKLRDLLTDIIDFNDSEPSESDWKNILEMVIDVTDIVCDDCGSTIDFEIEDGAVIIELCESCFEDAVEKQLEESRCEIETLEVEVNELQKELIDIFGITKCYDFN